MENKKVQFAERDSINIDKKEEKIGRIEIIATMVTFGTLGVFVKNIDLSSTEIALYRGIIAFIILSLFMAFTGRLRNLKEALDKVWLLGLSGAIMGIGWICLFSAYNYTTVALSTLAYYFAPTLIVIGSCFLFKEKLAKKQVLCFIGSTLGLVLIVGVAEGGSNDLIGIALALGAAVSYAVVILMNKSTNMVDSITKTWIQFGAVMVVLAPYVIFTGGFRFGDLEGTGLICMLTVGVFHTGIIYILYFSSLTKLSGQQAAIISYIDPMVSVFMSVFLLRESITPLQLCGGIMVVAFAMINEIKLRKKN